ncbi:MAG: tetratricopeptide repeat protein [bacterium]|nr:tetratricopeptide repeat protein [bacterium]
MPDKVEIWKCVFYGLIAVLGAVILLTFTQYGVTSDEALHVSYGEDIVTWYWSGFEDHSVFEYKNTWLYGGAFDTVAHLAGHVLPFDVYDTRHLCNALVGLLGVVAAYFLGSLLGGNRAGFLAALFLVLTPRYYGHGFNNGKDIPFAVGYLWSLYCLLRSTAFLPKVPRHLIWKTGLAIGLTMGVRANGVVLMAYLVLFYGIRLMYLCGPQEGLRRLIWPTFATGGIAYGVMFLFWPWLQIHPLSGLWDGIQIFTSFPEVHFSFFEGRYVDSDVVPWYYGPKWLFLVLPEFVLAGLVLFFVVGFRQSVWNLRGFQYVLLLFGGVFPLGYAVVSGTPLYDGIRQLLFVVPPLVVLGALGFHTMVFQILSGYFKRGLVVLWAGMLMVTCWDVVDLHPNQAVYFNRLFAGGVQEASLQYETDYWNHSFKQGIRWIEAQVDSVGLKKTIGSLYPGVQYMVDGNRFVYSEMPERADFYLGSTRFEFHKRVPGEILHTIDAKGVPILYIIRPDSVYRETPFFTDSPYMHFRLGDFYRETEAWDAAIEAYKTVLQMVGKDTLKGPIDLRMVHLRIGNIYLRQKRYELALPHYEQMAGQSSGPGVMFNNMGMGFAEEKNYSAAAAWIRKAVDLSPHFFKAYVNLGGVYEAMNNQEEALDALQRATQIQPGDPGLLRRMGRLCYALGRYREAVKHYGELVILEPMDGLVHYNLGLALAGTKSYETASRSLLQSIRLRPDHFEVYQSLGSVRMHQKQYPEAVQAYQQAIDLKPGEAGLYNLLGQAYLFLGSYPSAVEAFEKALEVDPGYVKATRNRQKAVALVEKN